AGELLRVAREARELCSGVTPLLVNDRPDVARLAEADGVHLGQDDLPVQAVRAILGPQALIGVSTHSDAEIDAAQGADYIGFGPIFTTPSKPGATLPAPQGLEGLRRAVQRSRVPVVAIGGIGVDSAHEIAAAGARCAASIAYLCNAPDPEAATRALAQAGARRGPLKRGRTAFEQRVLRAALAADVPVLGVCGGMQLLAVELGGTLFQDIVQEVPGALDHEQRNDPREPGHAARIVPGSELASIVGSSEIEVNSTHHQAVKDPGRARVCAVAPDQIVEAIELPDQFALGV